MNAYASLQEHKRPLTGRAKAMRTSMTNAECRLWFDCLQKLAYRFRKQRPMGRFIADFYCPELKLVIEVDGESHNSVEAVAYDQERTHFLQAQDLTVLRYTNAEVLHDLVAVNQSIQNWIAHNAPVPPFGGMSAKLTEGKADAPPKAFGTHKSSPQPFGQLPKGEHY